MILDTLLIYLFVFPFGCLFHFRIRIAGVGIDSLVISV